MNASALTPSPGFEWGAVNWGAPDEPRTEHCSYCGDALDPESVPLILWNAAGWCAEFCDHCQAAWFGIQTFDAGDCDDFEPSDETPAEPLNLGACCMCETRPATTIIMLVRRCAVPGHGWGCFVCGLPPDGASAVLCGPCADIFETDPAKLVTACRGYPAEDGRIAIAELPAGRFEHDMARHAGD